MSCSPPAQYINVSFASSSTPSEEAEEWAEDALSDMVAIPDGYRPISRTAIASMLREGAPEAPFDVYVAVGGVSVIDQADEKGFARRDSSCCQRRPSLVEFPSPLVPRGISIKPW